MQNVQIETNYPQYLQRIWSARYFWWHLALSDIRARFRRSYLGIAWAVLTPLLLTAILTLVMSFIFKSQAISYAPYVYSGLIVWEVITSSGNDGCDAFFKASSYIKQFKHPMIIYSIRTVLVSMIYMMYALIGLAAWMLLKQPFHLLVTLVWIVPALCMLFFIALPVCIVCGITNTQFRDFARLLVLIFQMVWYVSPIFISDKLLMKSKHLHVLVTYNPIYHLLELFRAPILYGHAPMIIDFAYVIVAGLIFWAWAIRLLIKNENTLIHYL
ncbi:MAG: hypothetical protein ACD_42C00438G0004 [uncultured bacterium]|nr:MAG: hypothetical protein ACD_42C00438G0004 [uncultured bacterium]OGT34294.1 MAG: hypothetical protein A3C44_07475 [Gammaproteobacteria bacterium RIFCSPHIGHO2_02_FULL_39_13]OGT48943.1 MAG: hypothetical protein A3E53_01455 [Gammaproteobacteria bacterium RIFCSPHIGHO2_12_FULL_39_24]